MRGVRTLLALLVLGQTLDALTFTIFYRVAPPFTPVAERNPVILAAMAVGGVAAVMVLKLGITWITYFAGTRPRPPLSRRVAVLRHVMLTIAATSGFVGAAFNTEAIRRVLGG